MRYFTLSELTRSDTAAKIGERNTPDLAAVRCLTALVERVLDPLREAWGGPIKVTSGYRSPRVNKAVGGSSTSQHLRGQAADLVPVNGKTDALIALAIKMGGFDQLINEVSGGSHWLHISYNPNRTTQRGQVLKFDGKKYVRIL